MSEEIQAPATLNTQLLAAAEAGRLEDVQSLIAAGAHVACADAEGISPLMKAAEGGHASLVEALLELGAPWHQQDNDGYCAGQYAGKRHDIVELLMQWGVQAEMALSGDSTHRSQQAGASTSGRSDAEASNADYLQQKLHYEGELLLDADGEAVMMGWERPLMLRHADLICPPGGGGDILNVGFGLGIVDAAIQAHSPRSHTIVEAHPDVYAHMLETGWDTKPGVRILFGRWQDVLPQLSSYDGVFFDTYGEYDTELRCFHEQLPRILKPAGVYSYFNGLCSDNLFFHSVQNRVVQLELAALGLSTSFDPIRMAALEDSVWKGVKNKYWHFDVYFLPAIRHASEAKPAVAVQSASENS